MARRTIIVCDLCKRETEKDSLGALKLKASHQNKQKEWEVCDDCLSILVVQLGSQEELSDGLVFGRQKTAPIKPSALPTVNVDEEFGDMEPEDIAAERRRVLAETEIEDDEAFIARKEQERREAEENSGTRVAEPDIPDRPVRATAGSPAQSGGDPQCSHLNKTRPFQSGKRMYRKCRDCGASIPMMTLAEKAGYAKSGEHDFNVGKSDHITDGD